MPIKTATLVAAAMLCFAGCSDQNDTQIPLNVNATPSAGQVVGHVQRFRVCDAGVNSNFNGGFSKAFVDIAVDPTGGTTADWAATGLAVAKAAANAGVSTSVEVTMYRSDIPVTRAMGGLWKWLAKVDYGHDADDSEQTKLPFPDAHSLVTVAHRLATQQDWNMSVAYNELIEKDSSLDDSANPRAAKILRKRFKLDRDPDLSISGPVFQGNDLREEDASTYFIDVSGQQAALDQIRTRDYPQWHVRDQAAGCEE
jgi:hypothetical protein